MCLSCGEHVAARLWYLEDEAHSANGLFHSVASRIIYRAVVLPGVQIIKQRQPYGTERWTGASLWLWNWLASAIHGTQVLPDVESAFKVIDLANEVGLTQCICRKQLLDEGEDAPWRCIGLNNRARIFTREGDPAGRIITKDEAKELVVRERQKGCLQSVGWHLGPNLTWLCNCDEGCGAHRAPELEWGMIPSFFIGRVTPDRCTGCGDCLPWCHRGAIRVEDGVAKVDDLMCWGCGLCVEHCPQGALALYPRSRYHDVVTRRIVELPPGELVV